MDNEEGGENTAKIMKSLSNMPLRCSDCGARVLDSDTACPECGAIFEENVFKPELFDLGEDVGKKLVDELMKYCVEMLDFYKEHTKRQTEALETMADILTKKFNSDYIDHDKIEWYYRGSGQVCHK